MIVIPDFKKNPRMLDWWCKDLKGTSFYQYSQDIIIENGLNPAKMPELPKQIIDPKIDGPDRLTKEQIEGLFNKTHFFYTKAVRNPQRWNYPKFLAEAEAKYGGKYRRDSVKAVPLTELIAGLEGNKDLKISQILSSDSELEIVALFKEVINNNPEAYLEYMRSV